MLFIFQYLNFKDSFFLYQSQQIYFSFDINEQISFLRKQNDVKNKKLMIFIVFCFIFLIFVLTNLKSHFPFVFVDNAISINLNFPQLSRDQQNLSGQRNLLSQPNSKVQSLTLKLRQQFNISKFVIVFILSPVRIVEITIATIISLLSRMKLLGKVHDAYQQHCKQLQQQIIASYISQAKMINKPKFSPYKDNGTEHIEYTINTQPIKSPSPDKKSSNMIAYTRSPALQEINKHITPIRQQPTALKILQKIEIRQKSVSVDVTPKNHKDTQRNEELYRQSVDHAFLRGEDATVKQEHRSKDHVESSTLYKAPESEDSPSQFQFRYSSRLREKYQSKTGELDYLRLLKEKQQTIKELRDLLDLIEKSNSGEYEEDERVKILERKLKEYSKQVKVLEIQNQCLISVIENNHVNLPSSKEEILQREIRQLRESLSLTEHSNSEEIQVSKKQIETLLIENKKLENECQKLLRLLKERDNSQKKQAGNNSHSLISKDKERITLSKIREQYNQNLKLAKENFENQCRDCYQTFRKVIEKEGKRMDIMTFRIQQLQQALRSNKENPKTKITQYREHQQIQSLLFQKYSKYMKELDEEKKVNEKLNLQLSIAWKSLRQLEMKSFNSSQDILNESQSQEISELSHRNSSLKNKLKELEANNILLKKALDEATKLKSSEIKQLQEKIEAVIAASEAKIKHEKESYTDKCNELEKLKSEVVRKQQMLKKEEFERQNLIQQNITEVIQTYEKQAEIYKQNLIQRAKIIENLQEENQFLRFEFESNMNTKQKDTDISKFSQSQKFVQTLEAELRNYKTKIQEDQHLISILKQQNSQLEKDNQILRKHVQQIKQSTQTDIQLALKESQRQLEQLSEKMKYSYILQGENQHLQKQLELKQEDIDDLKHKIITTHRENQEISKYMEELKLMNVNMNDQSFEEELKCLKKAIVDFFTKYKEQSGGKLLQNYYTIQTLYEGKIDENLKLQEQLQEQKDHLNRQQREKYRLLEKIANLQKNIATYEQQLKQRKVLYEGLLKEKSRIEKEIILSRRIKDSQNVDESNKGNVNQITNQIDRLVQSQRNRRKNIMKLLLHEQKQLSL